MFCALAMIFFAADFPAAQILLESSGVLALIFVRNTLGFVVLLGF